MNRVRYEGYVAAIEAISAQPLDGDASELLSDLAEGLLLARDEAEADAAHERVPEALKALVERRDLTRHTAARFYAHMKACGPELPSPPSLAYDYRPRRSKAAAQSSEQK